MGSAVQDTELAAAAWEAVKGPVEAAGWAATVPVPISAPGPSQAGPADYCIRRLEGRRVEEVISFRGPPPLVYPPAPPDLFPDPPPNEL